MCGSSTDVDPCCHALLRQQQFRRFLPDNKLQTESDESGRAVYFCEQWGTLEVSLKSLRKQREPRQGTDCPTPPVAPQTKPPHPLNLALIPVGDED